MKTSNILRVAELAHRVLVRHRVGEVEAQEALEGKAVQNLELRGLVRELIETLENQYLVQEQAGIRRASARTFGRNRREDPVQHGLENLPVDHRVEPFQRIALMGNLGQAFSQREEGKLCGTDQFRHSLLEKNPATFAQFKRPFLFGKLSF